MFQNLLIERFQIKLHRATKIFPGYDLVVAPGGPKLKASSQPDDPASAFESGVIRTRVDAEGFLLLQPGRRVGIATAHSGIYARFHDYTVGEFAGDYLRRFVLEATGAAISHIDKTGLTGKYDFTLKFDAGGSAAITGPRVGAALASGDAAAIGTAGEPSGLPGLLKRWSGNSASD